MKQIKIAVLSISLLALFGLYGWAKSNPTPQTKAHLTESPLVSTATVSMNEGMPLAADIAVTPIPTNSLNIPILMYHHVGPLLNTDAVTTDLTVSASDFEAQVKYFKDKGYHTVSLAQVYNHLINQVPLPSKPLVFTFDDGYKDVFDNAIPILEKYNYSGTFAIATDLLGRPTYAVWDDVLNAQHLGMEIVSHTENHLDLTNSVYSEDDLTREIFGSKQKLEQHLQKPVEFFVYPYGKLNDKVVQMVKAAGYKMAFTTAFGLQVNEQTLLTTPRLRVHGQNGLEKIKKVLEPARSTNVSVLPDTHNGSGPLNP
ncbi:MAG TPA: polysaccharide deacetylase family protein [Methylomirabilota bacterium]|nr:polysaccharide deacetylase family protein [Methylomirabilota bacterium]